MKELHERIDALVARAYGWPADLSAEDVLARLVTLNAERAREEKRGLVRWLRPDYQVPRIGTPAEQAEQIEAELVETAAAVHKLGFPKDVVERTAAVLTMLAQAEGAIDAAALARRFRQGRGVEPQVRATLMALARMGYVAAEAGGTRFSLRRAA